MKVVVLIMKAVDNMTAPCCKMISHKRYLDKLQGQLALRHRSKTFPLWVYCTACQCTNSRCLYMFCQSKFIMLEYGKKNLSCIMFLQTLGLLQKNSVLRSNIALTNWSCPSNNRGHCQIIGANVRWKYTECKEDCSKHMGWHV
jgi:hypothetical protein